MRCARCGLYNPSQYQNCLSCGTNLSEPLTGSVAQRSEFEDEQIAEMDTNQTEDAFYIPPYRGERRIGSARSTMQQMRFKSSKVGRYTNFVGILISLAIVLVSAGVTVFFLTKAPDDQRLLKQGESEIVEGQYAFAVNTLSHVVALRPNDAKAYLALARAYVGVDQVDKAWDCISRAQQLGAGVVAEPQLASDLANYYRQRGQYDRAIDLLRPLAKANIDGKKAELADLDALWGDDALRKGDTQLALRCWEEVHDLQDGSRFKEAEPRLTTIYQKLADQSVSDKDDEKALSYLSKLNYIAQNAKNYELAANIYERDGQLELAIDQVRKALQLEGHDPAMEKRLTDLLLRRGKELMDKGDSEQGYAYLQQAKSFDPKASLPQITLRNLNLGTEGGLPHLTGEVWNPGETPVGAVTIKVELCDTDNDKVLWTKENRLVDEFAPPLASHQSKDFEFLASVPVSSDSASEFKVYLDGTLYKSYPLGEKNSIGQKNSTKASEPASIGKTGLKPIGEFDKHVPVYKRIPNTDQSIPNSETKAEDTGLTVDSAESNAQGAKTPKANTSSPEEKTMKDLDY